MAAMESTSVSAHEGLLNHKDRKGSADLNQRKSLHSELKPALDDPELDQFWVTTDEDSDGDVPSRKAGRKVGPPQNAREQGRRPGLGQVSGPEARVSATGGPHSQRPTFAIANGNVTAKEQGVQSLADTKRSTYFVESPTSVDSGHDVFLEVQTPRRSFEAGEYEKNLAKLRELERQTGVERPLEAREAGAVVTRVHRKVDRLGIQDGHQREQVARCILEAELGRAHASATLSEWDGVGQGLRQLVVEKDAELNALRASTAEQKKLEAACRAAERDAETARQEATTRVSEVEKLTSERDHLRLALSDAEMDLQTATNLLGEVKQGLAGKKEEEKHLDERMARRQSSVKLQERLQAAQEAIRVNEGVIRGLEEQLRGVKEGYVKERQQWVKDAIAQQSTIMEHIKDRETYAKAKGKEVKKLGLAVEKAQFEAAELKEEVARKDAELEKLRAQLEERVNLAGDEKTALDNQVKEQTARVTALEEQNRAQNAIIAGLEKLVDERTRVSVTLQEESESTKSQLAVSNQLVKSLKAQVVSLQSELQTAKNREESLRATSEKAKSHEARAAEVTAALAVATARVGVLDGEKGDLRKALEASEEKVRHLTAQQETVLVELKEREANVAAVKAQIQKLAEEAEAKLHATVADKEAELSAQIVALETRVRESEAALERSAAEKEALEGEKRELLGVHQGRNNGQGRQERERYSLAVLQGQSDGEGSQERRRSFERRRSLEIEGPSGEDFVGMLHEKEQLLSRTMSDALQKEEEIRTLRREASEETAALAAELQSAREEREKLQLRTEFLRKKVGELKEQAALQSEEAVASVHARDTEVTRLRRELDGANRRAEQLARACRSLQTQLGHVGADVAPSGASGTSPTKRKRSRLDDAGAEEVTEGVREGSGVVSGGVSEGFGRVAELEAMLVGKSRELRAKEAEVRGLQEILRVLAGQLEEAEETPVKDGLLKENESGENLEVTPVKTPANSPTGSLSRSIDGSLLSAMKNALRGANLGGNSLEVSPAVVPRREPLDGSSGSLAVTPATKERLALKREIRELYDRLERKEDEMEGRLRQQTEQYRSAEREVLGAWREKEGELTKELEGKAAKLGVMEEAFQDLLVRLEEARTEAEAAVAGVKFAEQRAGEAEHARRMLKRRLQKLEEVDKTGDGMWRELARLAAANAALEDQIAQMSTAPASPALPNPSPQPRSSLQTLDKPPAPPLNGSNRSPADSGNDIRGSGNGSKGSPTGSSSGRDGVRLSNDVAANLSRTFGLSRLPTSSEEGVQPNSTKVAKSEAGRPAAVEGRSPTHSQASKRSVPEPSAAPRPSRREEQAKRPSTARTLGPAPSANSYESARRSAPVSPTTSPGGTARNAEELSNSVFDRLAVLRQRFAGEESGGSPTPSPGDPSDWVQPVGIPSPGGNTVQANSPSAASDKGAGSQDESATQTKGGGGAIRNLVRWFETKVPSKKSPSAGSSPAARSPRYKTSPGGASPGTDPLRLSPEVARSPSNDAPGGPPGFLRSPSNELLSDTQKAFARELPRLEVPGVASEAHTKVDEVSGKGTSGSPRATNVSPSSPGVRKRLEILRQRTALLTETSSSAEFSDEKPAGRGKGIVPRLGGGGGRPRMLLESNSSSDAGSPEPHRRTGSLRREERVSEGFGSPQLNAVPAFLSWIPPVEALERKPSVTDKPDVRTGAKTGDLSKGPAVSGRWEEAQSGIVADGNSPSSVLERLAVLKSRGTPPLGIDGAAQ
ncbi:hypothetical protein KFL_001820220 [Klebsormidium nitens]|uniref:Uncharacterized protein n=1 Tax=Klebsormidium nitens TaxID=105231 RepID=A0A1Y1I4B3_KLENI|nr:hypothetical protein KFL_001820220 [Klebsormidium nitens]|eukprot:GAQ84269.1 hypothetical protein KFL_001820220 [Klebsormidium nitens]